MYGSASKFQRMLPAMHVPELKKYFRSSKQWFSDSVEILSNRKGRTWGNPPSYSDAQKEMRVITKRRIKVSL